MFNDNDIEEMIQPLLAMQREMNQFVITKIAKRVNKIGKMSASDLRRLEQLYRSSEDVKEIKKEIAKLTDKSAKEIENIIQKCAEENYADVQPFYDHSNTYIPLAQNSAVQAEIEAIARRTIETYRNIANTTAYFLRDPTNRKNLIATSPSDTYTKIIDEAIMFARRGAVDYQSAIRTAMQQVIDSGLCVQRNNTDKVQYASGNLRRLDTAVRMNTLEGIKQINQGVQDITGQQFGANGKEISVHFAPAPDHEQCQGHMFTLDAYHRLNHGENVEDVNGVMINGFTREIGTLNCKHFAYSVIIGISEPIYSPEELDEFIVKNHEGIEYGSKHYTLYQAEQKQRQLETNIRRAKDGINAARASGDQALIGRYTEKYYKYRREYTRFSKAAGLSEKTNRTTVSGFRRPMSEKTLDAMREKTKRIFTNGENSGIINSGVSALPNALFAATTQQKIQGYLLNNNHPVGKHKARVINSVLGYHYENWQELSDKIYNSVQTASVSKFESTQYGTKYTTPLLITGKKKKSMVLNATWQIDKGKSIPRLITVTFDKRTIK